MSGLPHSEGHCPFQLILDLLRGSDAARGTTENRLTGRATTYTNGPFGQTTRNGTANANPYEFTGRELDPNSGLYYLRNRYYSPTLSRFLSPDPMGIAGGDANLYAYAHNDPTNLIDPLGLSTGGVGGGGEPSGGTGNSRPCAIAVS